MKQLIKFGFIFTIFTSGLIFTACEDGEPGIAGAQGEKGENGDLGDTGENGVGYTEATQYGNIVVQYKGTRPDDVPFDKTINFKYAIDGPDVRYTSNVWDNNNDGTDLEFGVYRYSSAVTLDNYESGSNNYVGFRLRQTTLEGEESYIQIFNNVAIISDDFKFFTLYTSENQFSVSETLSGYSFTSATGELKFKFNTTLPADGNATGHELEITADVNVKVIEDVDTPK
ncbi:hypothetical protein KK062_07700 [Fulvivirgaceae bacterium PWU5]|uniref:Collagen-like protein n=1 Tax=Dawidia cretensis TaxID=2782350 RepID=A0AAP2GP06_9BACT|nr:hypothetical protein [Dawidia cretensis]MBT1708101.1 hypothetical protein [Dawidia cretensis]